MSLERQKPAVVAFDGLHRVGKGTQAEMLLDRFTSLGEKGVIVRGDGTREGLGLHAGDPYSEEWQSRGARLKSPEGNTIEGWNAAAYILARELAHHIEANPDNNNVIVVDRTLLSRAAFLLHRGAHLKGERFTLNQLYPDVEALSSAEKVNLPSVVPDVIFDLSVDDPKKLLDRLDPDDPKYLFRSRNIRGGFDSSRVASSHLPEDIEERVVTIDALESPDRVHEKVVRHLGRIGILSNI